MRKVVWLVIAVLLLTLITGCDKAPDEPVSSTPQTVRILETGEIRPASDYEEIKQLVAAYSKNNSTPNNGNMEAGAEDEIGNMGIGALEYSGTNVQVEGVDEGDVVKTDGEYIYILSQNSLKILKADGKDTALLSNVVVKLVDNEEYESSSTQEIYVTKNRVSVLAQVDEWGTKEDDYWSYQSTTHVLTYDTTDKAAPKLIAETIQDGTYQTSRLLDGTLYVITDKYTYMREDQPDEDVFPCVYDNKARTLMPAESIYLCPQTESYSFTIISAVTAESGQQVSTCAFTDGTETVYMNTDGLYLARTVYASGASEPYQKDQYTVVDYLDEEQTEIRRVMLSEGKLVLDASCNVPGRLLNQFSMDVYNGYLRVASSENAQAYSIYTDEAYGFSNTLWQDSTQKTAVTILDASLQEVGKIDTLALDERVYSVRFMGDVGYVVTFKNIDPLFTLNLSNPTNPSISSELKATGVSRYLQSYGEGLLLGFGEAINENGSSDGLQLNMFNVSNPAEVKLVAQNVLDGNWSEALYNHKAILAEPDKNLIAFADNNGKYQVYSYESGAFTLKGSFDLEYVSDSARGLYIGNCMYVCSQEVVYVVDMNTFVTLNTLNFAMG